MSKLQTNTTHYFDGTKWLEATEKSCENCHHYTFLYVCNLPEVDMRNCLKSKYRNFWIPKEEPKTDRTCKTCVNFKSDEKCNFGKPYCSLPYDQRKVCLSSIMRQFWYKKEENKMKQINSEEIQKYDNDFNETLGFENKQSKKIKPTKIIIHEIYDLSSNDMEILLKQAFDLNSNDTLKIFKGETVSGEVYRIEIERKQSNFSIGG